MSTPLHEIIVARIREHGPLAFDEYMDLALYHPEHGYYSAPKERMGWAGHYVTSPELDPAFGTLWAEAASQVWEGAGSPGVFPFVEIGAGTGRFARTFLDSVAGWPLADRLRYRIVEPRERSRTLQSSTLEGHPVTWHDTLQELPEPAAFVFAHEVLDNVPVKLLRGTGDAAVELLVDERQGSLHLTEGTKLPLHVPEGNLRELGPARDELVRAAVDALGTGAAVFVDYGLTEERWADHPDGTVVCYSEAGVDDDPLADPGHKDITAHVDWSAVTSALEGADATAAGPLAQRDVLITLGAADLDDELSKQHSDALGSGDGAGAIRSLSRRQALAALLDRSGLGGLQVMAGLKGIEPPPFLTPNT